jgi:transcriptional regulator with XRE-family HTH domain
MSQHHKIDLFIGRQLRDLRITLGISQQQLAKESGITFQQIQKYEKAKNRISASRLYNFAHIFQVSILTFFPSDIIVPTGDLPPPSLRFMRMFNQIPASHHAELFTVLKTFARLTGVDDAD